VSLPARPPQDKDKTTATLSIPRAALLVAIEESLTAVMRDAPPTLR
jgi:hypothetical protein